LVPTSYRPEQATDVKQTPEHTSAESIAIRIVPFLVMS
jgi:hypothetical protein